MHLIYFDEVKPDSNNQSFYWLGGIAIDSSYIKDVEAKVSFISEKHFGTPCLKSNTEFHAADIFHRKHNFKSLSDPTIRVKLIGDLLRVLDDEKIKKLYVKIKREYFDAKFSTKAIDELAFMFFCEKANALMGTCVDIGMIIGDRESDSLASRYAQNLSNWRSHRTEYSLGSEIKRLIGTVHFTQSHLSRLLQLADVYTWCLQFRSNNLRTQNPIPKLMIEEIAKCGNALSPKKYKEYPLGC